MLIVTNRAVPVAACASLEFACGLDSDAGESGLPAAGRQRGIGFDWMPGSFAIMGRCCSPWL